jgi:hypothetical protein
MSEPFWSALGAPVGAGQVDYKGAWAAGTAYVSGDVVTYQGVTYLAVNPSTGVVPAGGLAGLDIGLALPASPVDGQEFILTDSLTAPTFAWKLRYMAGKASNKWVFVGGSPIASEVLTGEGSSTTSYVALATAGPSIALPIAGDYIVEHGFRATAAGGYLMSYDIGGTGAVDADACRVEVPSGGTYNTNLMRSRKKLALGAVTLTAKYKASTGSPNYGDRWIQVTPIAVGG